MGQEEPTTPPSPQFKSLGFHLRQHRLRLGLSQEALAEEVGVSARSIRRWELNLALPQEIARQRLARLFGVDDQYLFGVLLVERPEQPTSTSPLWIVPFPRNPCFIGREEILGRLHNQLTLQQPLAFTQSVALSGLGGIGKTQVAIEYAYRYGSDYRAVFWLAAETTESLMSSLQQIADYLQLPERQASEQAQMAAAVQRWLATSLQWLLIADNVEDLDLLQSLLPSRRQGALLLTTRLQALGTLAEPLEVSPMSKQESVTLLLRRARWISEHLQEEDLLKISAARAAEELVKLLEGLPLALDQAGAYLEETGCSVAEYVERYSSQRKQVLARRGLHDGAHPASVTTTLSLSVERIASVYPAAADLLRACAFLHPEGIGEEMLRTGASFLGPVLAPVVADAYQFDHMLATLRSASLVTRSPETRTLSVHRLVQAVLADQMAPGEVRLWSERVLRMVNATFPEEKLETWAQCERYLPQALACVPLIRQSESPLPEAGELCYKAGSYLMERGRYSEAEPLLELAMTLGEQRSDLAPAVMAQRLEKRAQLSWRQGNYGQAEKLLQRELRLEEHHLGPTHLQTAETLNNLALLYWSQGRYQEAELLHQRVLDIREQLLGPDHPGTALTLHNLGAVYRDQGKYEQAERLYQQALGIREQRLGLDHPTTAETLNNLAQVLRYQGKYEQAEHLQQQALSIREQRLGSHHPTTATTLRDLANLYQVQGRYEQAEPLYQRALEIYEQRFGLDHPAIAITLQSLANLYRNQGKSTEAESLYQRALAISEQRMGSAHPKTMEIRDAYNGLLAQRKGFSQN